MRISFAGTDQYTGASTQSEPGRVRREEAETLSLCFRATPVMTSAGLICIVRIFLFGAAATNSPVALLGKAGERAQSKPGSIDHAGS